VTLVWTPGYDDGSTYTPGKLVLKKDSVAATDTNINEVSLLLHGDGANGSTTITDSSLTPKTVTAVGNAQISTAQSKFGGASIAFDGNGDNLSTPDSDAFYLPADFTIECHLYAVSWVGTTGFVYFAGQYQVSDFSPVLPYFNGGVPGISAYAAPVAPGFINTTSGAPIPLTTWTHVAWVRSGNRWSIFVNGTERLLAASTSGTPYNSTAPFVIGRHTFIDPPGYAFNGYIDDFRITKGVARYTANFTPPTAPFPDY
jgi:hypothetical protein